MAIELVLCDDRREVFTNSMYIVIQRDVVARMLY